MNRTRLLASYYSCLLFNYCPFFLASSSSSELTGSCEVVLFLGAPLEVLLIPENCVLMELSLLLSFYRSILILGRSMSSKCTFEDGFISNFGYSVGKVLLSVLKSMEESRFGGSSLRGASTSGINTDRLESILFTITFDSK